MKRILLMALALIWAFGVSALAENTPSGEGYAAFRVDYAPEAMEGWQTVSYFDASGLLFSAFTESAEITVSLDENRGFSSSAAFLRAHVDNVSRYGRVMSQEGPKNWPNRWSDDGASMRYTYMYLSGSAADDVYLTDIYVAPVSKNYNLVVSLNSWSADAGSYAWLFDNLFIPSLSLSTQTVSPPFMAYFKGASEENGVLSLTLDFCSVEYDDSIFTVYVKNDEPKEYTYTVRSDALFYLPDIGSNVYAARQSLPDVETMRMLAESYYRENDMDGIYNVQFDENNEIVWMMHYNAF